MARRYYGRGKSLVDLSSRKQRAKFELLRMRFYEVYWKEIAASFGAQIEDIGYGFLKVTKGDKQTFVRRYNVMLDDHVTLNIAGNKPLSQRMLREAGYPAPRFLEYDLSTLNQAADFMQQLRRNVVIKPAFGTGAGRGITTKIRTYEQLKKATHRAAAFSKRLLVEEEGQGDSYRLLYLNGQFIDAIKRERPTLLGDGSSTVEKLITMENSKRLSAPPFTALSPITTDFECRRKLRDQGLALNHVPAIDERLVVKDVVNENSFRENHVIRDAVHPSIVKIGSEVASLFGIQLLGLDLIASEIDVPLKESGGIINEINTTPGLHHHYLISNEAERLPVGETILEFILSSSKRRQVA